LGFRGFVGREVKLQIRGELRKRSHRHSIGGGPPAFALVTAS
jgi:hypothetical protein